MKILITGVRGLGVGKIPKFYTLNGRQILVDELRRQRHEVEWRPIVPGEDLSIFGRVILLLENITDWGANQTPGFLYALYQRPDSIVVIPDSHEQLNTIQKQFAGKLRAKNFIFRSPGFFANDEQWREEKYQHMLQSSVELLASEKWDFRILFPALDVDGTDLSGFPTDDVLVYDPSPIWYKAYDNIKWDFENKIKQWSVASLRSAAKWASNKNFSWPVNFIGDKTLGQKKIPEGDCNQIFADSWGILIDEYKHVGCGYVRYKYVIAAKFGIVPYGDTRDFELIGPAWKWCAENLKEIELLPPSILENLTHEIREEYLEASWSEEQFTQFISELVERG